MSTVTSPDRTDRAATGTAPRTPLGRLVRSELGWVLRRPRTLVALGVLALLPLALGLGVALAGGPQAGEGPPLLASVAGNGLVLPVASLSVAMTLLLPLVVSMAAADALAGEATHGTLRGLLLSPVSRVRLVSVKAAGVAVVVLLAVAAIAVVGVVTGWIVVGGDGLITLSGTVLSPGAALGRVALAAGWVAVQMAAVAALALAVSAFTDHPLVVLAATMGGLIVSGLLAAIPALDWLHPVLPTEGWMAVADVLRDPMPSDGLLTGLVRAGCYLLIGVSLAVVGTASREG